MPEPLFPSGAVLDEIAAKFAAEPHNPFWTYLHDDAENKCAQLRAMKKDCDPFP